MSAIIVIPARYGSSRLPGKPMIKVAGVSMLERVWRIARATRGASRVVICTEDRRVVDHANSFGAEALLTSEKCENGTERVAQALQLLQIEDSNVINFQGDALLTPPWVLDSMIAEFDAGTAFDVVTPAVELSADELKALREHKALAPTSGTTVTFDRNQDALYFSKQIIPYVRKEGLRAVHRHIGIYGYTSRSLAEYVKLPASPLEMTEGLEQLRALENGMKVRIVLVDYRGRTHGSVDAPSDITLAESIIAQEGELIEGLV